MDTKKVSLRRLFLDRILRKKSIFIPDVSDPIWEDLIRMRIEVHFNHLGLRMLLLRQQILFKSGTFSDELSVIKSSSLILRKFFENNIGQGLIQRDLSALISSGVNSRE